MVLLDFFVPDDTFITNKFKCFGEVDLKDTHTLMFC